MEKEEKDVLEEIKDYYDKRLMSALVGAGFSKNVSDSFLSWGELLHDMIGELYSIDIKRNYNNYLHQNKRIKASDKLEKSVRDEYIKDICKKEDYLEIVSNYIKKKGFRECVEVYIENKIPSVKYDGKTIVLCIGDKIIEKVPEMNFSAHKELLKAEKLQNIYTTNYEELLEFTVDLLKKEGTPELPDVVKSGHDLSNKLRCRNIIKIHGSLRGDPDSLVGFDGDNKRCYIIAKEDYDTYKDRHEAFTSLMRIAMLQGKFLLLGFSGSDVNYKGWVSWMSDILEKEDDDTKIYIIDVSGKNPSPDLKLYYKNHHTKVVNLFDKDNLKMLKCPEDEISLYLDKIQKKEIKNEDKRNILVTFLKYLNKETKSIGEQSEKLDGNYDADSKKVDKETEKAETHPLVTILSEVRPNTYTYRKLWYEAYSKTFNKEDVDDTLKKIMGLKQANRFPKIIFNQDSIIDNVIRKTVLSKTDAHLLALAIEECGLNPHYYSKVIHDYEELDELPLWRLLKIKEDTFNGADANLSSKDDNIIYENIQRSLFHLDFKKANKAINRWKPYGYFNVVKAMRLASIKNQRDNAFEILSKYIGEENIPTLRLYAMQIANYISNLFPRPYNTDEFYQYGIDGIGDNLDFMVQQLRGKLEVPKTRGWIGSTMNLGGGHPEYEKSLRILRYISDTGLYVNFGFTFFFDKESWYQVFKNLYNEFPYPCFFYSIQYNDNSLLTRIGQDFAYSPKLSDFNKDILVRAINAYGDINTPAIFLSGLLNVTGPIYIAVDETIWFDVFNRNIFKQLIDTFDKYDLSDPLVKNAKFALVSLKNPHNVEYVLDDLLNHYSENQVLADSFIRDNLQIKYIQENVPGFVWNSLKNLISQFPLIDITELIFYMEDNGIMIKEVKDMFIEKVLAADIEALPKGRMSSFHLCHLTKDYPDALDIAKSLLLKHDVWHCGVLEDKKGWSMPNHIRLNVLKDAITWTDEEFNYISNNLRNNIKKYDSIHQSLHNESFMRNVQVAYLSDVISFIDGLSEERRTTLQDIRKRVEELLKERISYKNLIEGMLSEQSGDADYAMDNVIQGIIAQGLNKYLDEFNFILDRALMGDGQIINAVFNKIRIVVQNRPDEIKCEKMCSKLHTILAIYKDNWVTYQEFKPAWSFNHLYVIAHFLKENGYEDSDIIKFWLTDSYVKTFIRL
jgi:hypothetical protein